MRFIPDAVSAKLSVAALKAGKHSPTLLFAGGVVGVVGAAVWACRSTLKIEAVLEETQQSLNEIKLMDHQGYSEQDRVKDRAVVTLRGFLSITKLYGPPILLGAASVAALAGSHALLNKRNAALTAAYAAVAKGFSDYRGRVIDDLGEETDRKYLRGGVEETVSEEKDGKKVKTKQKIATSPSVYGRLFNEGNPNYKSMAEYNIMFIRGVENYLNDRLQAHGHVLLNDAYQELGFERTSEGCVVGWVLNGDGDGYIDFGIFDEDEALRIHDYVIGREGELYLDFNVDGVVYDKI